MEEQEEERGGRGGEGGEAPGAAAALVTAPTHSEAPEVQTELEPLWPSVFLSLRSNLIPLLFLFLRVHGSILWTKHEERNACF